MKKLILILCILMAIPSLNYAQDVPVPKNLQTSRSKKDSKSKEEKKIDFFIGGNICYNFGSRFSLAPELGVRTKPWFNIAVSPRYEMTYDRYRDNVVHAGGVSAQLGFILARYLALDIGYEFMNYENIPVPSAQIDPMLKPKRSNSHALLLAIGYEQYVGSGLTVYGKYVIWPVHSKYNSDPNYLPYNDTFIPMFIRIGLRYHF